ncbi:hypothetical protein SLA2020_289090 [Shorea laevis]
MCFAEGFHRQIGEGTKIRFWTDIWLGTTSFKQEFPRLYNLSLDKKAFVADYKSTKGEGWHFKWRHAPFGRELDEQKRLENILQPIDIPGNKPDIFNWIHNPTGYSAKLAYIFLDISSPCLDKNSCSLIWNPLMPSKVSFLIWRLFLNRLPTKENLLIRGVNQITNPDCVFCGAHLEEVNHIFVKCRWSQQLWSRICYWWGYSFVSPDNALAMLHQLSSLQIPRKARSCWKLTISATVWAIWFNRNNIVFGKQYWDENRLIDLVQTKTFSWIKGNSTSAKFSFVDWCQFPTYCAVDF